MLLTSKTTNDTIDTQIPMILALNSFGNPLSWISYEDSAYYKAKGKILWTLGEYELTLRGGINAKTGKQSLMMIDTIIALDCDKNPNKFRKTSPTLTNSALFARDKFLCGYCGSAYKKHDLTRDHVVPRAQFGLDTWTNTITACRSCNNYKADKTPEQAGMELLFLPYLPKFEEFLILQNRKILYDQMEFLCKNLPKNSRIFS